MVTRFSRRDRWFIVLFGLIYMFNFIDCMIIAVVGEPIRREFGLSDLQLGVMGGVAFALFYGGIGIPLARLAERISRVGIVAAATAVWSIMTVLSGLAGSYGQLLAARIGVGIGEAGFTLVRRFGFDIRQAALTFALVFSAATALGGVVGGMLADRFASADLRRYGLAPAISTGLAVPLHLLAIYQAPEDRAIRASARKTGLRLRRLRCLRDRLSSLP